MRMQEELRRQEEIRMQEDLLRRQHDELLRRRQHEVRLIFCLRDNTRVKMIFLKMLLNWHDFVHILT